MTFNLDQVPCEFRARCAELQSAYELTTDCTKGANGYLVFARNKQLNRKVAIKFYYWGDGNHVEPANLAKLEHDSVLTIDHAEAIDKEYAFFVARYCEGGDLDTWLESQNHSLNAAMQAFEQIAAGVSYLHSKNYAHRDLKPSNIFVANAGRFVLGDFGSVVALGLDGSAKSVTKHSILYRPPEDFEQNLFSRQGDIYQLGLVMYQLLGGSLPYDLLAWFSAADKKKVAALSGPDADIFANSVMQKRIQGGRVLDYDTLPFFVPTKLKTIVRRATRVNMADRYNTVADMLGGLNNAMQRNFDWILEDGHWIAKGRSCDCRCVEVGSSVVVEKRRTSGWRRDNTFNPADFKSAAQMIDEFLG